MFIISGFELYSRWVPLRRETEISTSPLPPPQIRLIWWGGGGGGCCSILFCPRLYFVVLAMVIDLELVI